MELSFYVNYSQAVKGLVALNITADYLLIIWTFNMKQEAPFAKPYGSGRRLKSAVES
jgi:hypothetical protein